MGVSASDSSRIVFPLRSNAKTLLTGKPLSSVRRRMKLASLLYDTVLLEAGVATIQAGPTAATSMCHPVKPGESVRWQTPTERGAAQRLPFFINIGPETTPGVPAQRMVRVAESESAICWEATLEPFKGELPPGCDWIEWVESHDPVSGDAGRLLRSWVRQDHENAALRHAIPERFVRSQVVKHANRDLVLAIGTDAAVSQDSLHVEVIRNRFEDDHTAWRLTGYALPLLVPDVGALPWEALAALRREKGLQQLRGVLEEVELETSDVALAGGDLEAAVHHAAENQLAKLAGKVDSVAGITKRTAVGLVVGAASGVATVAVTGPIGLIAEPVIGSGIGAVLDYRSVRRDRRARQWVGVLNRLRESVQP